MTMETLPPKETIISVLKENRSLRWVVIFLGMTGAFMGLALLLLARKPSLVWVVQENGRLTNSKGFVFDWEVQAASQRAMEVFYVPDSDREKLLPYYYSPSIVSASSRFMPHERLVLFKVRKIEPMDGGIKAHGVLVSAGQEDEKLDLTFVRGERSEINPFGLVLTGVAKAKDAVENKQEGLAMILESTANAVQAQRGEMK